MNETGGLSAKRLGVVVIAVLVWIPIVVSAVLIGTGWMAYWIAGAGSPVTLAFFTVWFLLAACAQLFSSSPVFTTTGLVSQSFLSVILIVRLKATSSLG